MSALASEVRPALTQLVLKPTVFCYHRCSYCDLRQDYYRDLLAEGRRELGLATAPPGEGRRRNPGHMPRDLALRVVDEAAELGMRSMQLSGGDPLLYPHLQDVIEAGAAHPGVFVFMNSVGTGITADRARTLIEAGLGAWNFSVDTLDPVAYDEIRGVRRAFARIQDAIATVQAVAVEYTAFCVNYMAVITRRNFRGLPGLVEHCVDTGIASLHLMNVYGDRGGNTLLTLEEIGEFRDRTVPEILEVLRRRQLPEVVQTNARQVLATFYSADNPDQNYAEGIYWPSMEAARAGCNTPNFYSLVEPDGRVLPCCLVEISHEGEVGNVTDRSLGEVWNGPGYRRFRADRIPFCQECSAPRHRTLGLIPSMCRQFNDG